MTVCISRHRLISYASFHNHLAHKESAKSGGKSNVTGGSGSGGGSGGGSGDQSRQNSHMSSVASSSAVSVEKAALKVQKMTASALAALSRQSSDVGSVAGSAVDVFDGDIKKNVSRMYRGAFLCRCVVLCLACVRLPTSTVCCLRNLRNCSGQAPTLGHSIWCCVTT